MILRNDLYSFTAEHEDPYATPVYNSNTAVTIGGILKTQIDSKHLKIVTQISINQSDLPNLELIIDNYTLPIYYTPSIKLYNRQTIEEIQVIMSVNPKVDQRINYDDKLFYITLEFEEVIIA